MTTETRTALELLVDAHGLHEVLNELAVICGEKAEHLRANWQDGASARAWDAESLRIGKVAGRCRL